MTSLSVTKVTLNSQVSEVQCVPLHMELDVSPALYLTLERLKTKACRPSPK